MSYLTMGSTSSITREFCDKKQVI